MTNEIRSLHVDSNVLLRFLTGDPPELGQRARQSFVQVREGSVVLVLEGIVVAETVWVLQSFYRRPTQEISERVAPLLSADGIECPGIDVLSRALLTYS